MQSGCALLPQIDPMYGPNRSSEAEQARRIVRRLPENSVVMADSGFGIFSVGYHLPCDAAIEVAIHEIELDDGSFLYLVTTLQIDATSAAELYSRRYDVEFDVRDLKVTMDAENILAHSVVMVKKELRFAIIFCSSTEEHQIHENAAAGRRTKRGRKIQTTPPIVRK